MDLASRTRLLAVVASAIVTTFLLAAPATAQASNATAQASNAERGTRPSLSLPTPSSRTVTAVLPHPVAGSLQRIALSSRGTRSGSPVIAATRHTTDPFDLVGATWRSGASPAGRLEVKVRHGSTWSRWHRLAADDGGASAGSVDAATAAARRTVAVTPLWVGAGADAVRARIVSSAGAVRRAPVGVHLILINGGQSPADSPAATARLRSVVKSPAGRPFIYTRRDWGAQESLRQRNRQVGCGKPKYASTLKVAFIHHTDTPNGYSRAAVPAIIRSMYRYHVLVHGWCDIGYNFLVDRFGRIWEGRYGGMNRPVIGAQAGGFNVGSLGVGMIGTFNSVAPDRAMRNAVVRLLAWRLAISYRDPTGRETLKATHFNQARYRAGRQVPFQVVSGHRNADFTDCPGTRGYAALPGIRRAVMARIRAGLVDPSVRGSSWRFGEPGSVTVHSTALKSEAWRLAVVSSTGTVVDTVSGQAAAGQSINAHWDGHSASLAALPAPPGRYSLVLTPIRGTASGIAYTTAATVAPEVTITGPATTAYGGTVTLRGEAIPGAAVTVAVSGQPTQIVTASAGGTWSASYQATASATWTATAGSGASTYTTPPGHTEVVPVVTNPGPVGGVIKVPATTFTLSGTAMPLSLQVSVEHDGVVLASSGVALDGTWSATITVPGRTTITVVAAGGATSPTYTVVP